MARRTLAVVALFAVAASCSLCQEIPTASRDAGREDTGEDVSNPSDMSEIPDSCSPETDEEYCARLGRNCGTVIDYDNCDLQREVECGDCPGDGCGANEPNVCGCPCSIDGECYVAGEPNPQSPCEVCDPARDTEGFTPLAVGVACDDGTGCTASSACDGEGSCVAPADDPGCGGLDDTCTIGVCEDGSCVARTVADGDPCPSLACATGVCTGGACDISVVMDGFCIDPATTTCLADGEPATDSPCMVCDGTTGTLVLAAAATPCDDGDGLDCTTGACDEAGACNVTQAADTCLIDGACYAAGAQDPLSPCMQCDPGTNAWIASTPGTACAPSECSSGTCGEGGVCTEDAVDADACRIGGTCYAQGEENPANECERCDPSTSQTTFTGKPNDTVCGSIGGCACEEGTCRKNNGMVCP